MNVYRRARGEGACEKGVEKKKIFECFVKRFAHRNKYRDVPGRNVGWAVGGGGYMQQHSP